MMSTAVKLVNGVTYKRKLSYEQQYAFCRMLDYLIIETNLATNPKVTKKLRFILVTSINIGLITQERYNYYSRLL